MRHLFPILTVTAVLSLPMLALGAASPGDLAWFQQARFGMFIHWGAYSLKGVEASWPLFGLQVPRAEYEGLATRFNPTRFDPVGVARLAKRAGMKYVIITSKHHDGYAMFDTKLSDYSIVHSPYGKDVCKMLADACRAEGLRFGFYFSLADWHNPDYMTAPQTGKPGPGMLPEHLDPARWEQFVAFMHGQVRELCTGYGPLDVLWFDGGWEHTPEQWKSKELHEMIRKLQPHILINDRGGGGFGDYGTPEQTVPDAGPGRAWETCMTINNTWAYNPTDRAFKSVDDLLGILAKTSSGGGNLLLDIGPMPTGEVQPEFVERLEAMGRWVEANGASLYGVMAGPRKVSPENRVAMKKRTLFIHLLNPPADGKLVLHGLLNPVLNVRLLSTGQHLPSEREGSDVCVHLGPALQPTLPVDVGLPWPGLRVPGSLKHEVVAVFFQGPLETEEGIKPDADGSFTLPARDVTAHGLNVCYQAQYDDIGCWFQKDDWVSWKVNVPREATYEVIVAQGVPAGEGGTYLLTVGDQSLLVETQVTGSWTDYRPLSVATVRLGPGARMVSLKPWKLNNFALMNVKWVKLVPVP